MSKRSSFTVDFEQRYRINQLKKELENKLERRIFDQDLMDILLETFERHQHKYFIAEAQKLIELAKEVIITAEDVEKLKEENEELRRQVEELKSNSVSLQRLQRIDYNTAVELFLERLREEVFVKRWNSLLEKDKDLFVEAFKWLEKRLKNPIQLLLAIGLAFVGKGVEGREPSEANINYGGRLW